MKGEQQLVIEHNDDAMNDEPNDDEPIWEEISQRPQRIAEFEQDFHDICCCDAVITSWKDIRIGSARELLIDQDTLNRLCDALKAHIGQLGRLALIGVKAHVDLAPLFTNILMDSNCTLTQFIVSSSELYDCPHSLVSVLKTNLCLRDLQLLTRVSEVCAIAIAQELHTNTSIRYLALKNDQSFTASTVRAFASMLCVNTALQSLKFHQLSRLRIEPSVMEEYAAAVERNSTIHEVAIPGSKNSDIISNRIEAACRCNEYGRYLLGRNDIALGLWPLVFSTRSCSSQADMIYYFLREKGAEILLQRCTPTLRSCPTA